MKQKRFTLSILAFFGLLSWSWANCPGCVIDVPAGIPEDTLFLGTAADGIVGQAYDSDISFRMPKTTDPVNAIDPDVPAGFNINEITILSLSNLPAGLSWEANATSYDPQDETDGCLKFCGLPLEAGLFVVEVTVEATVAFLTQETSFPIEIYIAPAVSISEGFTMTNNVGCGELSVGFDNNVPSNGQMGYSYFWDFGNGSTSQDENPATQTYDSPGTYVVSYEATIDTIGYTLTRVELSDCDCDDFPTFPDFTSAPDMHFEIRDPSGSLVFESETIWNTNPPIEAFPNLLLGPGNYEIKVIDQDSGINGADDVCALTNFTLLSDGTLTGTDFILELEIFHPVEVISSTDTVEVLPLPDAPVINAALSEFCEGEVSLLTTTYENNNVWLLNGTPIPGVDGSELEATEAGVYSVQHTNAVGCMAMSSEVELIINAVPEDPVYTQDGNLVVLLDGSSYPANATFQWYLDGVAIAEATESVWCITEDGEYTLEVLDPATGCTATYTSDLVFDASIACTTSAEEENFLAEIGIYPNPVKDELFVQLPSLYQGELRIVLINALGQTIESQVANGQSQVAIDMSDLPLGWYILQLQLGEEQYSQKIIKM